MFGRRAVVRRGPGLLGMAARTAVVAGTATAVSRGMSRRMDNRAQEQAEAAAYEQSVAQQQASPPPAQPPGNDLMEQLQWLVEMRDRGMLSDEEFATAKARLLGG
jgi:hypothetical protein